MAAPVPNLATQSSSANDCFRRILAVWARSGEGPLPTLLRQPANLGGTAQGDPLETFMPALPGGQRRRNADNQVLCERAVPICA
jgi:hypothetical protein